MNIFDVPKELISEELIQTIFKGKDIRIERIVSMGQASDKDFWYDQDEDEWVLLVQGSAVLDFENERINLNSGDTILIPAHKKHRVEFTSTCPPCVWICVFGKLSE